MQREPRTIEQRLPQGVMLWPVVQDQVALIRLGNTSPAFAGKLTVYPGAAEQLHLSWRCNGCTASLHADLKTFEFTVSKRDTSRADTRVFRSCGESARSRVGSSGAAAPARL